MQTLTAPGRVGATHAPDFRLSVSTPVALTHFTVVKSGTKGVPEAGTKFFCAGEVLERSVMEVVSGVSVPVRPVMVMSEMIPVAVDKKSTLDRSVTVTTLTCSASLDACAMTLVWKPGAYVLRAHTSPSISPSWSARLAADLRVMVAVCVMSPEAVRVTVWQGLAPALFLISIAKTYSVPRTKPEESMTNTALPVAFVKS
mmetsp:Transcript_4159/g.9900  ORF Transcript_4159/g.9900 Transcript_4159/m.9900 type:complete len:200 (+) Transcript_4159:4139-4738(+)